MASGSLLFKDVVAIIMEQGLGKARRQILVKQLEGKGGLIVTSLSPSVSHIIVSASMKYERLLSLLRVKAIPQTVAVVNAEWLSTSLIDNQLADTLSFLKAPPTQSTTCSSTTPEKGCGQQTKIKLSEFVSTVDTSPNKTTPISQETTTPTKSTQTTPTKQIKPSPSKRKIAEYDSDSDYIESDDEGEGEGGARGGGGGAGGGDLVDTDTLTQQGLIRPAPKKGRWMCQIPASQLHAQTNHNEQVTNKLEELLLEYKNSSLPKDKWRAMSLTKAIAAIKRHPKEISTYEEAHGLPFVGKRLADKIYEIVSSGHLRRLDHIDKAKQSVIDLFKGIHGVGQVVAEQFYAQGYRTLQDLKDANILNRQQLIGLKYYDDFAERMQRSEVKEIEEKVREGCREIDPNLEVVTCGSFRRGKPTCGDVDILITHPDGRSHKGIFSRLLKVLKSNGFLTDDLTTHEDPNDGSCKYFGVCRLPGNEQKGMSLSEHSLNVGVIRKNGVKVYEGTPLPVFSEADVFKYLEVDYLEPHDRDLD